METTASLLARVMDSARSERYELRTTATRNGVRPKYDLSTSLLPASMTTNSYCETDRPLFTSASGMFTTVRLCSPNEMEFRPMGFATPRTENASVFSEVSMSRTLSRLCSASLSARAQATVVVPTPPFRALTSNTFICYPLSLDTAEWPPEAYLNRYSLPKCATYLRLPRSQHGRAPVLGGSPGYLAEQRGAFSRATAHHTGM